MTVVVMKFGGSCLVDAKAFGKILNITEIYKNDKKIYVASALNGITDLLLKTAQNVNNRELVDNNMNVIENRHNDIIDEVFAEDSPQILKAKDWVDTKLTELEDVLEDIKEFGLEPYYQDYVASFGEILSTYILNQYLLSKGLDAEFVSAKDVIITNDEFNNAYPLYDLTSVRFKDRVIPLLENPKKNTIVCITGFVARNKIGYITTLGRGGSDYTATIVARSVFESGKDKDVKVILWKDVDGLLAINPKFVPQAALIKNINYSEAKAIANFGAKILHPKCLEAIERMNIPLEIRNFDKPLEKVNFTNVSFQTDKDQIKGISTVENTTIITIVSGSMVDVPGVLAKIFKVMGQNDISVSLVSQSASEVSTSFVVKRDDANKAIHALKASDFFSEFFEVKSEDVAIINITGTKILENKTKVMIFDALDKKNIHVKALSQSSEELNLSLVVDQKNLIEAIKAIHQNLCEVLIDTKCSK